MDPEEQTEWKLRGFKGKRNLLDKAAGSLSVYKGKERRRSLRQFRGVSPTKPANPRMRVAVRDGCLHADKLRFQEFQGPFSM